MIDWPVKRVPEDLRALIVANGADILAGTLGVARGFLLEPAVIAGLARIVAPAPGAAARLLASALVLLTADVRSPDSGAPS